MSKLAINNKAPFTALDADAAQSFTLPGYLYSDPATLDQEKQKVFFKEWQLVGHKSQLRNPGDYVTWEIAGQKIFVVKGRDEVNRAFFNVCQHRAHQLLEGQGNARSAIVCPYHAWTYRVDGSLRTARGTEKLPNFDPTNFGLTPVRLEEALGFLFVNLDNEATAVTEVYAGLFEDMTQAMPWIEDAVILPHAKQGELDEAVMPANWKVLAENCLECYHCTPAHPAFVDLISVDSYSCTSHGHWQKSHGEIRRYENRAYPVDKDAPIQDSNFWHLFPNTQFGCLPGDKVMTAFSFMPREPGRTFLKMHMLAAPGHLPSEERCNYVGDILWPEDEALCKSVHEGLQSLGYRQGRFVIHPDKPGINENGVHHFQKTYASSMALDLAP